MDLSVIYRITDVTNGMSDVERLSAIYAYLSNVLDLRVEGALVEVGCNTGHTSIFLQMVNMAHSSTTTPRELHVFDSFQGLPESGVHDRCHVRYPDGSERHLQTGDLAVTPEDLMRVFQEWNVDAPIVHPGWFDETLEAELPASIAFCYLDADFYDSILTGMRAVVPRLSPGGVLIVDDYCDPVLAPRSCDGLPGVKKACDAYFAEHGGSIQPLVGVGDLPFGLYRKPRIA
jgi:O-methyltransferase